MKKSNLIVLVCALAITTIASADILYSDFGSASGLNLLNNAEFVSSRLRLAQSSTYKRGNAWHQESQSVSLGFSTTFDFQYTNIGGNRDAHAHHGTDGLAFRIQSNSNNLAELDFRGGDGITVWFDAFDNALESYDFSSSRVEVSFDGVVLGQTDVEAMGIIYRNQGIHTAKIDYDGDNMSIVLDGLSVATYSGINLSPTTPYYAGFHGATGGAYADTDVLSWSLSSIPEPTTLLLLGLGGLVLRRKK